jgi:hypothetical protein
MVEKLPTNKDDIEAAVVDKFLKRLRKYEGRDFSSPDRSEPWPDFECSEGAVRVGIELVELMNEEHGHKRRTQKLYAAQVQEHLGQDYLRLSGLDITLFDNYQDSICMSTIAP